MSSSNDKLKIAQTRRWHTFENTTELGRSAVKNILISAQEAIDKRGAFLIVLAGGTTPRKLYEALRKTKTDWHSWHVYFGDERCLPVDHADRNSKMAAIVWLDHVDIPRTQIHPIQAENGAAVAAAKYAQLVKTVPLFDLVLLGLGEDGHTASLFPDHELGDSADAPSALVVTDAPKPPSDRVSLSAHRLSCARQVMFLVTGSNKANALQDWRSELPIPAASITPATGVDIYIEKC